MALAVFHGQKISAGRETGQTAVRFLCYNTEKPEKAAQRKAKAAQQRHPAPDQEGIMKGFTRTEPRFSLCGLNCALCSMHLDGYCPGCGGGAGNQSCGIARCSLEHGGVSFCWQCPEYPCPRYEGFDAVSYTHLTLPTKREV